MAKRRVKRSITVAKSHTVARRSQDILSLALNPWPTNFFPADYGFDGDVKITESASGKFAPRLLPWTFQFQLKATSGKVWASPSVRVEVRHLELWLSHNVPTILFFVNVNDGKRRVFWKCLDSLFLRGLALRHPNWLAGETVTVRFAKSEIFDGADREPVVSAIKNWKRPIRPS